MSPITSHRFVIALLVVITTVSLQHVDGYQYYYYYYYYPQPQYQTQLVYYTTPQLCNARYNGYYNICPRSSCYCSRSYSNCCLNIYQGRDGQYYDQCLCTAGTACSPTTPYDSASTIPPPAPTTAATTLTTTIATTRTTATAATTRTTATTPTTPTTATTATTPTTTVITTTPTTIPTTTPPFKSLCSLGFRLLNGETANQCDFNGIANITMGDGTIVSCNAVYAPATVNGRKKMTFVTAQICKNMVEQLAQTGTVFEIEIGKQRYPIDPPLFNMVDGPDGSAFIDINTRYTALLGDLGCQEGACPYDKNTMKGKLDFSDCKFASWGASNADTLLSSGLFEAKVALSEGGCTSIPDVAGAANTLCFKTKNGANLFCSSDRGAPVYCKAPSNGEWILVGVAAFQADCDTTSELKVIQIPS